MKRKKIKSFWIEYFNFSARERRGAFFLACILAIQISFLYYQRNRNKVLPPPNQKIISSLIESMNTTIYDSILTVNRPPTTKHNIALFDFDPNILDKASWLKLGISEKQISVINKYISHGGKYRIKNDFKKMYCISKEKYISLEPYLLLPDSFIRENKNQFKKIREPELVFLDNADSVILLGLKGVGPVFASRIIRYREKLGGFYSLDQIKEVWGITDSIYQSLLPSMAIQNSIPFRFIHLNTDTFGILASHPYIKGKIAGLICNYRKQHKSFTSINELKQLPLITEENFLKLAPYIKLD